MKPSVPMSAEAVPPMDTDNLNPVADEVRWYALRAFRNKTQPLMREAQEAGFRTYYAVRTEEGFDSGRLEYMDKPLVPALFFIQCPLNWLQEFRNRHFGEMMVYTDSPGGKPAPIRDKEMEVFILVTSAQNDKGGVEYLGDPKPQYMQGDLVRVTEGLYKGAQGVVKRIKKDRKLIIAITGVAMVAISHIPMCYLEKVE